MALQNFPIRDTKKRKRKMVTDDLLKKKVTEFMKFFDWEKKELYEKCKKMKLNVKPIGSKGQFLEAIGKSLFGDLIK